MNKYILIVFLSLAFGLTASAQTEYNLSLSTVGVDSDGNANGTTETDKFNVVVSLSFDAAGDLGGGNVRISFDENVLSNPVLHNDLISANGSYLQVAVTQPETGVASLNIVHFPGSNGMDITTVLQQIAVIQFDVAAGDQSGTSVTDLTINTEADMPASNLNLAAGIDLAEGSLTNANGASLPIELSSFDAERKGERTAKISWTTETEINASHFEVEKSYSGENFRMVGQVDAVGESKSTQLYSLVDNDIELIPNQVTPVYYRLRMVDNDGAFEYSEVKIVKFSSADVQVDVHPNPTTDFVTVATEANITAVAIVDVDGKIISKTTQFDGKLDFTGLNNGMYKVLISTDRGEFVKSIIKLD